MARSSLVGEYWRDQYIGELLASGSGNRLPSKQFDSEYLQSLIAGDPGVAFHFTEHFRDLLQFKLRPIVENPSLCEDLVQESLFRTITHLRRVGSLSDPHRLEAFVLGVSEHVLQEHFVAEGRRAFTVAPDLSGPDFPESAENGELAEDNRRRVAEVLATLPQRDQNLLFQILVSKRDREEILREFEVDHAYWRTLLQRVLDSFQQSRPHDLKDRLLEERTPLLTAKFLGRLTNGQSCRLESIEADLEKIEIAEADEFDKNYPQSPMGRIEAVLERLESSLQSLRPGREQTS